MRKAAAALLATLSLSACLSFGGNPPPTLMRLEATERVNPGQTRTGAAENAITVVAPAVGAELRTTRVPVRQGGIAVAYVRQAQWVDQPSLLFARLLGEVIQARTGRVVLDQRQFTFDPGHRVTGQLLAMGVDADRSEAVVTYDAAMSRGAGNQVETRRFEARVPVATVTAAAVAPALNQAANQVATQVAQWIG